MSSVKHEAALLQAQIAVFADGVIESKLIANLEAQSLNVFGRQFSTLETYISNEVVPSISRTLETMITLLVVEESQNPGKPLLSVHNLRIVYTAIELLWQWGILPTISKLTEFAPPVTPFPTSLLVQKRTIDFVYSRLSPFNSANTLDKLVSTVASIVCNDTFSGLMLQRNLDRILLAYFVLSNHDIIRRLLVSDDQLLSRVSDSLRHLYTGPFASMVVTKLRSFTKGPVWLRDASCSILSSILQGHRGVETVLSGYLEGSLDSSYAAALQAHVAKLVTTPPAMGDKSSYLENIAEQVRDLLLYGLFKNDKTLMRVCVLMVIRLSIVNPVLCSVELMQPLAAPLLALFACSADDDASEADVPIRSAYVYEKYLCGGDGKSGSESGVIKIKDPAVLTDVLNLQSCVEMLHLLVTLCPLHAALARALCVLNIDTAMLHLYTHVLSERSAVSVQLFDTVESFLVNLFRFGGSKMVVRVEFFMYDRLNRPAWAFQTTKQGLVEVRIAPQQMIRSVSSIAQVLQAVKGDGIGQNESVSTTSLEASLQTVRIRLHAVTAVLLICEESIAARSAQMDVDVVGPNSTAGAKTADRDGAVQSGGWELLGSELFLRSLAGFLRVPINDGDSVDGNNSESETSGLRQGSDAALSGVVVLELQEKLPFVALLRDGLQILRLLKAFVEHYAQELATSPADQTVESAQVDLVSTTGTPKLAELSPLKPPAAPVAAVRTGRRVLIEELPSPETEPSTSAEVSEAQKVQTVASVQSDPEMITSVLGLLAAILSMGHDRRPDSEETLIRSLLEPLQAIAFRAPRLDEATFLVKGDEDTSVAQTASDVALMILSRSYQQSHPESALPGTSWDAPTSAETFAQMIARMRSPLFLFSESPAMRGYATRIILQSVQRRVGAGAKLHSEDVAAALDALLPQLSDQESFVYLNALVAIRQLSEAAPKDVFSALLEIFAGGEKNSPVVSTASIPTLPEGRRAMVGEALVMLLHRAESLKTVRPVFRMQVVELLPTLVRVCLAMAQRRASAVNASLVDGVVNLQTMRITASAECDNADSPTNAMLLDDAQSTDRGSTLTNTPQVSSAQLERAIAAADADILRQSAVSLLTEALALAGAAAYRYLDDVLDLALGVLNLEQGHGESARAARRAAAYLASRAITLLCESVGAENLLLGKKSRTYDSFQHTYEMLQRSALHDTDEVVKFHASRGIYELQEVYAKLYAVREDSSGEARMLEKFRIVK